MTSRPNPPTEARRPASPILSLLSAQALAALAVGALLLLRPGLSLGAAVALQALAAMAASRWLLRQAPWWPWIHALFLPSAVFAMRLGVHPAWYIAAFALALAVFGNAWRGRVPLFLSSQDALDHLDQALPREDNLHFVDLGCGSGRVLQAVRRLRPNWRVTGVEAAWLPYLWARWRLRGPHSRILRGDFWSMDLSGVDVVYTYLSPLPMGRVWKKLRLEMRRGWLISYRFALPATAPELEVPLRDGSRLYRWTLTRGEHGV